MSSTKRHIIFQYIAIVTMVAFLMPFAFSFSHSFQDHEHFDTCTFEGDTHLCESHADCDFGELQIIKKVNFAFAKAYSLTLIIQSNQPDFYKSSEYTLLTEASSSRGPPVS